MGDLTVGDVAVDINGVVLCVCRRCYVFLRLLLHICNDAYVGCAVLDRKIHGIHSTNNSSTEHSCRRTEKL